jgi:hypothetical protein
MVVSVSAQAPRQKQSPASLPAVSFVFDHPQMEVPHYEFQIDAMGKGTYKSKAKADEQSGPAETLNREFNISPEAQSRIFDLAKEANYFDGKFDFTKTKIAFTGTKILSYSDQTRNGSTTYNWTENKAITELTRIFQGMSATLEAEPRLRHLRRFDKLGLNAELARLEQAANSGFLTQIGLIGDCLQEIAHDGSVMGMARKRAEHLLQLAASQR